MQHNTVYEEKQTRLFVNKYEQGDR